MNLKKYIEEGLSWDEYIYHIKQVIEKGDLPNDKYQYYSLNLKRVERLLKTFTFTEAQKEKLNTLSHKVTFLMITEGWCGDAAQILPIVHLLVQNSPQLNEVINLRDSNELINSYLTNGGKSIPIIIGVDSVTNEELFRWGPRPKWASETLKKYKSGEINHDEFGLELQKKYNKDKGNSIVEELLLLLNKI